MTSLSHFHHLYKILKLIFVFFLFDNGKLDLFHLLAWMGVLFKEIMNDGFGAIDVAATVASAGTLLIAEGIVRIE